MADFSIWEVLFLLCFAVSWPVSIAKSLRTKMVIGKSPFFMSLVILGYIFGIIHKALYSHDIVIWLYVFNATLVATDLTLYFVYIFLYHLGAPFGFPFVTFLLWQHVAFWRNLCQQHVPASTRFRPPAGW